jgi:hypothetical protein
MQFADRSGIPPQLLKAQVAQESGFNANAFRYEPLAIDFAHSSSYPLTAKCFVHI